LGFWRNVRRRGVHVSTLKLGSRGDVLCFGGILGCHADLRRELKGGNLILVVFGDLGVGPRKSTEEGGHFVFSFVCLGVLFLGSCGCKSQSIYE
jgi:hypothetical protein